jgi:oxaloacetate decarboxylase (Na+ extruding) subunit alpha
MCYRWIGPGARASVPRQMAEVQIVDQSIRDGPQSLWGMRIRGGVVTAVGPQLDRAGYHTVEVPGGSFNAVLLRYLREDPIEFARHVRACLPTARLRGGVRPSSRGRYGISSYAAIDFCTEFMVRRLGIDSVWVYDCLYNMPEMERLSRVVHAAGAEVIPAVMYGISPVHTDAWFAERVREMVSWGIASSIYVEDAPGILTPERTRTLIPALLEAAQGTPVELHCHNTTGLAPLNYLEAVRHGVRILHTCSRPVANGPSLPSTEATLVNLEAAGHTCAIDRATLAPVAEHLERFARREGHPIGEVQEYDARIYEHQVPGGMMGTFKAQLAQHGMEERLPDVLEEIPRVRADLGHPVSATPFSQLIGTQAVLNVVSGERYRVTTDEVALYVQGIYGEPPAPIDPDVKDRLLSTARGRELIGWRRPERTLEEVREECGGRHLGDEDLFRLQFAPPPDIDATRAAGPLRSDYPAGPTEEELVRSALEAARARHVRLRTPSLTLDVVHHR